MKKCKACAAASIGKTMAKKTRKSSPKGILITGAAITGGLLAGAVGVPKLAEMVVPTADDKTVNIGTLGLGILGAMYTKGHIQTGAIGMAAGAAVRLVAEYLPSMGYVVSPSYDVNRIIGAGDDYRGTTGLNPGDI